MVDTHKQGKVWWGRESQHPKDAMTDAVAVISQDDTNAALRFFPTNARWPRAQDWGWKRTLEAKRGMRAASSSQRHRARNAVASENEQANVLDEIMGNSLEELARGAKFASTTQPAKNHAKIDARHPEDIDEKNKERELCANVLLAAANGDFSSLRRLLTSSRSTRTLLNTETCRTRSGMTPLMLSAARGDGEAVDLLLDAGASAVIADNSGICAVHLAAIHGHVGPLSSLVTSAPETITWTTKSGDTALMSAARGGSESAVAELLASMHARELYRKYDTAQDELGVVSAVNIAAASKESTRSGSIIDHLVRFLTSSTVPSSSSRPSTTSSQQSSSRVEGKALELALLPAAILATRCGNASALSSLISTFPSMVNRNVNRQRETLVMQAAAADQPTTLGVLMETSTCNMLCTSVQCKTILHIAATAGSTHVYARLLRKDSTHNTKRTGGEGVASGRILEILDAVDEMGETPLMAAVRANNSFIVRLLLESGASLVARSAPRTGMLESTTPLHIAAAFAYFDAARTRRTPCDNGRAIHEQLEIIDMLLANGADVDAVDASGRVARHIAMASGNVAAAEVLALHARKAFLED